MVLHLASTGIKLVQLFFTYILHYTYEIINKQDLSAKYFGGNWHEKY